MAEEAVVEEVESSDFDMDSAVDDLGSEMFPNSTAEEPETEEVEETDESEEVEDTDETDEVEEEEKPVKAAPQSWKKEMHEKFASLDPEVQEYIEQREEQMKNGLEADRTDANMGRTMRDIMKPHSELLEKQGINEVKAVEYLLNANYKLSTGTPEQRQMAFKELAKAYGLDGENVAPETSELAQRLQNIESNIARSHQAALQATKTRIESEVEAFASEHEHFDDLQDEIAKFISVGYELEDAYDKALWANPLTRQKELDRIEKEKSGKAKVTKKAVLDKAKNAKSVNVRGRNTDRASTVPLGTMDDTLNEVLRDIQNRK